VDESFDFNIDTLHHSKSISTEWRSITGTVLYIIRQFINFFIPSDISRSFFGMHVFAFIHKDPSYKCFLRNWIFQNTCST